VTNVRSSISSSKQEWSTEWTANARLPSVNRVVLITSVLVALLVAFAMETVLKSKGIQPTAVDDVGLWMRQRARASALGKHALILVGASRIQTDIDLDVARSMTNLEPVQLAIDASSFFPILAGLAEDESVRGTVIVSYQDNALMTSGQQNIAEKYEYSYESIRQGANRFSYAAIEPILIDLFRNHLRSYADGTRPLTSLLTRVFPREIALQKVIFLPDRSRLANYSHLNIAETYYSRVLRELGEDISFDAGTSYADIDAQLAAKIEALPIASADSFAQNARLAAEYAQKIESRGGHVIFVVMPTSGLITSMENRRYPKEIFWKKFVSIAKSTTIDFEDVPALTQFPVPDGSHMDFRTRAAFTHALLTAIAAQPAKTTH
jgi:hypothetical protein